MQLKKILPTIMEEIARKVTKEVLEKIKKTKEQEEKK